MSDRLTEKRCDEFVSLLGSSAPVPGGGSVSGLVAALGAALGNMVGCLTTGKKKYADVEDRVQELMTQCETLQKDFLELAEKDAEAFRPLSQAYGMPAATEEEKAEKARVMETVLADAAEAPAAIVRKCRQTIDICGEFARIGSRLAVSDAGVGVIFAKAAMKGAALNVYINTKAMADRQTAAALNEEMDSILAEYGQKADRVYDQVMAILRENND